ncbi:MAG: UPF0182 family protein [Myxococcales bacterium]|nr:UPF0182 family protein [Myxococcales bacterium]
MPAPTLEPPRGSRFGQVFVPLFVLLVGLPAAANLYVDLRWFRALGHTDIFATVLSTKWALGGALGAGVGLFALANLRVAFRFSEGLSPLYLHDPDGVPRVDLGRAAQRLVWPVAIMLGLLTGLFNYRHWMTWLLWTHAGEFGHLDPIFGRDVGFYMFQLPLLDSASGVAMWALSVSLLSSTAAYVARGAVAVGEGHTALHPRAQLHLGVLGAAMMALLAYQAYLDMFHTLYSTTGPMVGASYADVHAKLPALRIKIGVAAVGSLLLLVGATREGFALPVLAGALYILTQLGVQFYPSMVHKFSVLPNEFERESTFLQFNIEATRRAYGLDAVTERELSVEDTLTAESIANNAATIDNIRLWDHQPLLDTFAQIQEIRTYYDFASVDNDRYMIDGQLRQTMLSPRELSVSSLPNRTWINERFTFTHGYGLTLGPVNEATPEGLPVLFIKDIPPTSATDSLKVTRPSIYYGELSNDHVFVRTRGREFHYPSGSGNVETDYDGKGGIRFDSTLMRLAMATKLGSLKLLLSNDLDSDSRVLLHRNILERVGRVLPFLSIDPDPYMVVRDDGTLAWIIDCYTTSNRYPYAESSPDYRLNYIRNSVKVIVDAYDGGVEIYISDPSDPLISAWMRTFPRTFHKLEEMPADLRRHVRYPELIFRIQTETFTTYHMGQAQLLYNREDQWQIPSIKIGEARPEMKPYYTVMKLPGEHEAEFIQMLPFTPKRKENLAAWMVARSDGDALGELVVYRFPKDRLVFGPQQVVNRINQDAEISRQISLWDQRGSQAEFGTLLVIPIEGSLIYVRPLYLRSEGGKIPELKRVIVVHEKRIAMKPSLREAMEAIFGEPDQAGTQAADEAPADGATEQPTGESAGAVVAATGGNQVSKDGPEAVQALQHFERAVAAQRAGDWAKYGEELDAVERLLRKLQPTSKPALPPPPPVPASPGPAPTSTPKTEKPTAAPAPAPR